MKKGEGSKGEKRHKKRKRKRERWLTISPLLMKEHAKMEYKSMLSIPYCTGRYGWNIPYRPVIRYARPLCFIPEKIPAVPANFGQYRPVPGVPAGTEKSFYFYYYFFLILSPNSTSRLFFFWGRFENYRLILFFNTQFFS